MAAPSTRRCKQHQQRQQREKQGFHPRHGSPDETPLADNSQAAK
jgi:hypothetical protein